MSDLNLDDFLILLVQIWKGTSTFAASTSHDAVPGCRFGHLEISHLLDLGLVSTLATSAWADLREQGAGAAVFYTSRLTTRRDLQQSSTGWPSDKDIVFDSLRPSYFGGGNGKRM